MRGLGAIYLGALTGHALKVIMQAIFLFSESSTIYAHLPLPWRFKNIISIIDFVLVLLQLINSVLLILQVFGFPIKFVLVLLQD
jgi:hypothetical protein